MSKMYGVEYSDKTALNFQDAQWKYGTSLSEPCTWKCKAEFNKSTDIPGYR